MRYDFIGWTLAAIKWWKHKDDKAWDVTEQPPIPELPEIKTNIEGVSNG